LKLGKIGLFDRRLGQRIGRIVIPVPKEQPPMKVLPKLRLTMATAMMLVVTCGMASALFAKIHKYSAVATQVYLKIDAPILFVVSIVSTAIGLGALKSHSANQTMIQTSVACFAYLTLIWIAESGQERPLLYWFQISFALMVTAPLLARRIIKSEMPRGPRRDWWKKTCEAIFFAFLTMMLVLLGILIQWVGFMVGSSVLPVR
jgi:hypothetical protein